MKKMLIIPDINNIEDSLELAKKYGLGFEYNDFFNPDVLDDEKRTEELIATYKSYELPLYSTLHGAFFDVIPFSMDKKIKEISEMRINQSIDVARRLGAAAVVFHTNYNPFLNTAGYIKIWIEENVKFWSRVLEANKDINIYLENMFDTTPDILRDLSVELCRYDNYGVCLDYGHASISNVKPEEWVRSLSQFIKHIHINDNDLKGDLHLPWGYGEIDRDGFYKAYEANMSDASILIETSAIENQKKSIDKLIEEGFISIDNG